MKLYQILLLVLLCAFSAKGVNKVSNNSGSWNNPAIWTPFGVPAAADNVTITSTHIVDITSNATCNDLQVGAGANSMLRYSGFIPRTLIVNGNLIVNSTFMVRTNSNTTHNLRVFGNITNNGTIDLYPDGNSRVDVDFNNTSANQSVSGAGALVNFYSITLTKSSKSNEVDFTCSNFAIPSNFLTLNSGTIKFSFPANITLVPSTNAFTIPTNGGVWVNSAFTTVSYSAAVTLAGDLIVTAGNVDIGNANNEDLVSTTGSVIMTGGTIDVAGKYRTTGTSSYSMTGGTFKVPSVSTSNNANAPFNFTANTSTFNMSGGAIIIRREGGNGTADLGYVNTGGTAGSVTGGTLQIGDLTTPTNQTVGINSTRPIPTLLINSANITAKIITNNLTVVNDVNIISGTFNPTTFSVMVFGNWKNTGNFVPSTSTVNFSGTAAQSITKSTAENFYYLNFSGAGLKTFQAPISVTGNFSIASGASVDVSTTNYSLSVARNFANNGTFNTRSGLILLNGTTAQVISGSSTTSFYDLRITNAAGVTLSSPANLLSVLTLSNGVLNTGTQVFKLISNASNTARVGPITGTGNLNGNVTVQRFMPGGATGWALMGTPIASALTFSDWDDNMTITCASCPDGYYNFTSIYGYDETQPGIYDAAASYVPITNITNSILGGKGYWVYLGNNTYTTTGITSDVTGTIRKFAYNINLTRTNTSSVIDDGWNLIHNPYPCPISWTSLKGATANLDNAYYVYNADLNGGTGGYASYVNGISSPGVGSGGIGDQIPMGQGFYVHSTGATLLTAQEAHKVPTSNPTYLRSSVTPDPMRIHMDGPYTFKDETVLYFQTLATDTFDDGFDAYKMRGQDPYAPSIALVNNTKAFQINAIPSLAGTYTAELLVTTGYSGTYTLSASNFSNLPTGTCFSIFDRATNSSFDLRTSNYVFNLLDTTQSPRFVLNLKRQNLLVNANVTEPSCSGPKSASIVAVPLSNGPWSFTWKINGQIVQSTASKNSFDTLQNLSGGMVELEVYSVSGCDHGQKIFNLNSIILPTANFSMPDSSLVNFPITFNNNSISASKSFWTFGDGLGSSNDFSPMYNYANAGTFAVKLVVESSSACVDSVTKMLKLSDMTGLTSISNLDQTLIIRTLGKNQFNLLQNQKIETGDRIQLLSLDGKSLMSVQLQKANSLDQDLNLSQLPAGIVVLRLEKSTGIFNKKLLLE